MEVQMSGWIMSAVVDVEWDRGGLREGGGNRPGRFGVAGT